MSAEPKTADSSTEEKIKEAARKVFTKKGYGAARTRDIAEEAGINLALLNYYFRSKEKLFELVMREKMEKLFGTLIPILNDEESSLETKTQLLVTTYVDMLLENPDMPIFVLSEVRKFAEKGEGILPVRQLFQKSSFVFQLKEKRPDINPLHFLMNLMGMTVFPFVMRPVLTGSDMINDKAFKNLMLERKALIPLWTKFLLKSK